MLPERNVTDPNSEDGQYACAMLACDLRSRSKRKRTDCESTSGRSEAGSAEHKTQWQTFIDF